MTGPGKHESMGTWPRRKVLQLLSGFGAGAAFGYCLLALAEGKPRVTEEMIRQAEWTSGLTFTDEDRKLMLEGMNDLVAAFERVREVSLPNSVPPALAFRPLRGPETAPEALVKSAPVEDANALPRPDSDEDLAFLAVSDLSDLVRSRQVSSVELTRLYLDRLARHDKLLQCVITFTEDLALEQARQADRELAGGHYRGPLHGIPWGAKDLLAVPGYPTTWGATPFRDQRFEETATVAARLAEAGAVLVAKLTMGALAWGDEWYGGKTKNPWKPDEGSSGSSAGSASATAAGLVGFSIGTETWGSIVSPSLVCGTTGLRPSYGLVSRFGAMALAWSLDKIGPITRSVQDLALVFDAIRGSDPNDPEATDHPFTWPPERDLRTMRVGYVRRLFEEDRAEGIEGDLARNRAREEQEFDLKTLEVLRELGAELVPIDLPDSYPVEDVITLVGGAEWTAAFDELTRSGQDDLLRVQKAKAWPNEFRKGQLIPAVEYVRANRIRTLIMREMGELMRGIDLYLCPSNDHNSQLTNLTGHPAVVLPNGFRSDDGTPSGIVFVGRLYGESDLLAAANAYQRATVFHLQRPPAVTAEKPG